MKHTTLCLASMAHLCHVLHLNRITNKRKIVRSKSFWPANFFELVKPTHKKFAGKDNSLN